MIKMERRKILILGIAIAVIVCALTFPVHAAEPTTSVHVIKYASDGATILNETAVTYEWMKTNLPVQGDEITEFYLQGPVFDCPPGPWDPDETTNFKDKGAVKGTDVKDLCGLVGGMSPGDEIKASASDGFSKWFNYTNVYEPQPRQGPIVLCWYKDGNYVPEYEEGMQIVFFADNSTNPEHKHVFGNWDMHECLAEKYWHNFSAVYPSTNGLSVKYIDEIAIYSNETTWNLELTGAINETMSKAAFEEGVACHSVSYTDSKNRTWVGIPLWYLMGMVDDTVTHGSGAFNDTLANEGYDVTVIAGDGYSRTFNSTVLARNGNYIVACYLNGSALPEFDAKGKPLAPLKLVGPEVFGGNKVGNIVKVVLDIAPAPAVDWNLTLNGTTDEVLTYEQVKSLPAVVRYGHCGSKPDAAYKGVLLSTLLDRVDGDLTDYQVKVVADDGYAVALDYSTARDTNTLLSYDKNGTMLSYDDGGPLMLTLINSSFCNQWNKHVNYIEIVGGALEWNLELTGAINETMSKTAFEEGVACHSVSYTDYKNRTWEGIPLWYLMGRVDDTVTHGSGAFNDTLADAGYDVTVIAGDEYSKTFNSTYLARNDSYIVACYSNGSELPEFDAKGKPLAPLKLVGPYLSGGQKVGNIVKIALDIAPAPSEGNLTLRGNETKVYTLDEIKAMLSYTAGAGFKKSSGAIVGPYTYKSVNVTYLAGLVGGLTPSNSVKVTASDGYAMTYTYNQIMGDLTTYNATTGEPEPDGHVTMVLAYEEGGNPIPNEYGGPLRVAFVGPDSPITDGHFWIKWVNKIEILGGVEEWNLTLRGAITEVMDRSTFESGAGCHGVSWTDSKGRIWKGMPLWLLAGWVDDADEHDFNDTLADKGYNVTVIASDGYSKTFNSTFMKRNDNIIVANELNGTALPEKYLPLRLVGHDLKKSEMLRNVVEIRIPELMPPQMQTEDYTTIGFQP
jgi:DMSO/TMAO reductase YedYZ molybdopterin-dependent catalytic subunit